MTTILKLILIALPNLKALYINEVNLTYVKTEKLAHTLCLNQSIQQSAIGCKQG